MRQNFLQLNEPLSQVSAIITMGQPYAHAVNSFAIRFRFSSNIFNLPPIQMSYSGFPPVYVTHSMLSLNEKLWIRSCLRTMLSLVSINNGYMYTYVYYTHAYINIVPTSIPRISVGF